MLSCEEISAKLIILSRANCSLGRKALPSQKSKCGKDNRRENTKIDVAADYLRRQQLTFDVISRKIIIDGQEMTDRHFNSLLLSCNVESGRNISAQVFRSALMSNCVKEVNPVVDYLRSLDLSPFAIEGYDSPISRVASMVHVSASPLTVDAQPMGTQKSRLRKSSSFWYMIKKVSRYRS